MRPGRPGQSPIGTSCRYANAAVTLVACPVGTEATDFQPGLTINGSGTASCLTAGFNSTIVVDWNSGANSVIRYNLTVNIKPAGETVFVSEGEVVSGQFAGAQVVRTTVETTLDVLKCLTVQGVMTASGPTALVIAG